MSCKCICRTKILHAFFAKSKRTSRLRKNLNKLENSLNTNAHVNGFVVENKISNRQLLFLT